MLPPTSIDAERAAHEKRLKALESENYTSARGVAAEETFELDDDDGSRSFCLLCFVSGVVFVFVFVETCSSDLP